MRKINNCTGLRNEINLLTGNINRMCITEDMEELFIMSSYALERIRLITEYNAYRIKEEIEE